MKVSLTIEGEVVGKGRPRFATIKGRAIAYTPKKTSDYENYIKVLYTSQVRHNFGDSPIRMAIKVNKSIPKSVSKKKHEAMLSGSIRPVTRPDLDNYYKLVADALNKIAYDDDSQIVTCEISKYYSDKESIDISITDVI